MADDAARRAWEQVKNVAVHTDWETRVNSFVAIRLSDGHCDGILYGSKRDAVRHARGSEHFYAYFSFRTAPNGFGSPKEAAIFLAWHRAAYDQGWRLPDPDDAHGGPDMVIPDTHEHLFNQLGRLMRKAVNLMPEGLVTEDGTAIDLEASERDFARSMMAPEPDEPEHPAPPKREQLPEDELGAKYGWTTDPATGQRRAKRAAGRPKARMTDARPTAADKAAKPSKGASGEDPKTDYSRGLGEFTSAMWVVLAAVPVPAEGLRVKIRAQAAVLRSNTPGLVQGVNLMAQHNGTIRRGVEFLTMGSGGWILPATMAVAPFAVQSAQLWRMNPAELVGLAEETEAKWKAEFEAMTAAMSLGDQEANAEAADINERADIAA